MNLDDDLVLYIHHNKTKFRQGDKGWHIQQRRVDDRDPRKRSPARQAHLDKVAAAGRSVAGIRGFEWYHGRKFPAALVRMYEKMKGPEVVYYYDRKKRRREELLARFNRTGNVIVKLGGEIVAVIRRKDLPYKYVARDREDRALKERELRKKALRKKRSE
jgi:hypothetical protein